jgi:hypothetical protein
MSGARAAYDELYVYTMGRRNFILQHVVDAHGAQTADASGKPIAIVFALVGLYLHLEKGFTGTQVQQAHIRLGRHKREWPSIALPHDRGAVTALEVMAAPSGAERDAAIDRWCEAVWNAFGASRDAIIRLLAEERIVREPL